MRQPGLGYPQAIIANQALCYTEPALLMDSRVLGDQELKKRTKQHVASLADSAHKREEPQGQREWLLGEPPMRTKPAAPHRPEPCHRLPMVGTTAVAICIAHALASSVVATRMVRTS